MSDKVMRSVKIEEEQHEYAKEHDLNVSHLLRRAIEEQMEKDQG